MNFELLFNLVTASLAILFTWLVMREDQGLREVLTHQQVESYKKDGILVIKRQIFSPEKLEEISGTLLAEVTNLPKGSTTEFSSELNSPHLQKDEILRIAREKTVVDMAAQLLETSEISIFTTRYVRTPVIGQDTVN